MPANAVAQSGDETPLLRQMPYPSHHRNLSNSSISLEPAPLSWWRSARWRLLVFILHLLIRFISVLVVLIIIVIVKRMVELLITIRAPHEVLVRV